MVLLPMVLVLVLMHAPSDGGANDANALHGLSMYAVKHEVANITYSKLKLPGWEAGSKKQPAVLMLQEW